MMPLGVFTSKRWGRVNVMQAHYDHADGPLAIVLMLPHGEKLGNLSVNMYQPQCSRDSKDLPPGCFYVKEYGDMLEISIEALASGLFKARDDLPEAASGYITARVWEVVKP